MLDAQEKEKEGRVFSSHSSGCWSFSGGSGASGIPTSSMCRRCTALARLVVVGRLRSCVMADARRPKYDLIQQSYNGRQHSSSLWVWYILHSSRTSRAAGLFIFYSRKLYFSTVSAFTPLCLPPALFVFAKRTACPSCSFACMPSVHYA